MKTPPQPLPWKRPACLGLLGAVAAAGLAAESGTPAGPAFIDEQGRTHVTRVVPAPATISAEGRARLTNPPPSILSGGASVAEQRARIEARQARDAEAWLQRHPATIMHTTVAGVPVCIVTPRQADMVRGAAGWV